MTDRCGESSAAEKLSNQLLKNETLISRLRVGENVKPLSNVQESHEAEFFVFQDPHSKQIPMIMPPIQQNQSYDSRRTILNTLLPSNPAASALFPQLQTSIFSQSRIGWMQNFNQLAHAQTPMAGTTSVGMKKEMPGEDAELKRAAKSILDNLQPESDIKLQKSRFVAYLKDLTGETSGRSNAKGSFKEWKESFIENISHIPDESGWSEIKKDWEQYQGTGLGYDGFARKEFSSYQFSVPIGANPFRNEINKLEMMASVDNMNLRDAILLLEAVVHEDPNRQDAWSIIGALQQANEIDAQAIAALYKATDLNPNDSCSWVKLAASCANETCIPDAIDALRGYLKTQGLQEPPGDLSQLCLVLKNLTATSDDTLMLLASSIIHNMAGKHNEAIQILRNMSVESKDWAIFNRLGASLANSGHYQEALKVYKEIQTSGVQYPRVFYNEGIANLCIEDYPVACRSFIKAIQSQVQVDIISGVREELHRNYTSAWEALRIAFELSGQENLAELADQRRMDDILLKLQ